MLRFLAGFICLFSVIFTEAQTDSVLLMNGKIKLVSVDSVSALSLHFNSNKKINKDNAFEYYTNNQKTILYKDRSANYFTQDQMREVIFGKQIAHEKYDARVLNATSFLLSFASSIFDTYESVSDTIFTSKQFSKDRFFKREPTYGQIIVPIVFTFTANLSRPKLKAKHVSDIASLKNELHIEGYQTIARKKKFFGSLYSGFAGMATGMLSYYIFK